jgi:hypothetical protein
MRVRARLCCQALSLESAFSKIKYVVDRLCAALQAVLACIVLV